MGRYRFGVLDTTFLPGFFAAAPNLGLGLHAPASGRIEDATPARVPARLGLAPTRIGRAHEAESRVRVMSRARVSLPVKARGLVGLRTYEAELAGPTAQFEQPDNTRHTATEPDLAQG